MLEEVRQFEVIHVLLCFIPFMSEEIILQGYGPIVNTNKQNLINVACKLNFNFILTSGYDDRPYRGVLGL